MERIGQVPQDRRAVGPQLHAEAVGIAVVHEAPLAVVDPVFVHHPLKAFVDACHQNGIGVLMDFVPVHFAVDGYALARYDGDALYESPGPRER